MHPLTGDKTRVLDALGKTVETFQNDGEALRQQMNASLRPASEADRQQARRQILGRLRAAYAAEAAKPAQDQAWYLPRSATVAAVQTAMSQRLGPTIEASASRGITDGAGVPGPMPFSDDDPLWIEAVVDALVTEIRGKANFVTNRNPGDFLYPIEDQCKMALMGDWGADNPSAVNVSQQVQNLGADYVIHLGDIYYAGQDNEAQSFLRLWPRAGQKRSFALNGNHEMYSGGHAYFEKVLPAPGFGQPASYFGLRNTAWQFIGVDTAYVEHRLLSDQDARLTQQFDWLVDKLKDTARRNVLLSHHQPLSAFAADHSAAAGLRDDIGKLTLAAGPFSIFAWFFGHEHRCTIYDDTHTEYRARLIGHGAMPMDIPNGSPDTGCVPFTAINQTPKPDGSGYLTSGFALLTLDGPQISIQYVNEDGSVWQREQWP